GNTATSYNGLVTLALGANPGSSTLGGTLTATAVSGVATFSGLTLNKAAAGATLVASATGLTAATTSAITITPGTATQVVVTTQRDASIAATTNFGFAAAVEDAFGNIVIAGPASTSTVSVALGVNTSAGGALSGPMTSTAVGGIATFSTLQVNKSG